MLPPSEDAVRGKLRQRGAPEHVVSGGSKRLVSEWKRVVGQVEEGYPLGLAEYRNDLDVRSLIAEAGLDSLVAEEDERLRQALTGAHQRIWESDTPDAFWVRGWPRNASGELLEDLRAEGLV